MQEENASSRRRPSLFAHDILTTLTEPRSYAEILSRGHVRGEHFRIESKDSKVDRCLLIAPHGGGIEPGTSEIMRAVAELGGWAFYEFAGFLHKGNKENLHLTSTVFDEPTLMGLLPRAPFAVSFHGADKLGEPVVYAGGKWKVGREVMVRSINAGMKDHGIRASDATTGDAAANFRGLDDSNIANRCKQAEGVQLEFSREARNLLFPPDSSREARGRAGKPLRSLASSIHSAIEELRGHCR